MNQHNQSLYFVVIDKSTDSSINFHKISPPFFSIEEAETFQKNIAIEHPECVIYRQTGLGNAETHTKDNTTPNETQNASYGVPSTSTMLEILTRAALDHLGISELEYLSRSDEHAELIVTGLSKHLMDLGCLYANNEDNPTTQNVAELIWSLSHQMDHVSGLLWLASEASFTLKQKNQQPQRGA